MPIRFSCPSCGVTMSAPRRAAGREAPCAGCGLLLQVPGAVQFEPPPQRRTPVDAIGVPEEDDRPRRSRRRDDDDEDDRLRRRPGGFKCPFCGGSTPPKVTRQVSTAGWIIFVILLLACFPLCALALFVTEDHRSCHDCGIKLG